MIERTKRNLVNDIKILKANRKTLREFSKEKYIDENGNANIDIYVKKENLYNPFTDPKNPELSNDFISHIEQEAFYIPVEYPIHLHVHGEDIDKEYVSKKLKEHYWKSLASKEDDLKKNGLVSIVLLVLGVIFLSLYFFFSILDNGNILFNEILTIIGSFAIWEAADYFILARSALRIKSLNLAQLALIEIE